MLALFQFLLAASNTLVAFGLHLLKCLLLPGRSTSHTLLLAAHQTIGSQHLLLIWIFDISKRGLWLGRFRTWNS
jgi:hypothetical protein